MEVGERDACTLVLEVTGLRTEIRSRRQTVHAVDGVSFSVAAGQTVALVGESGCGKSMTGLSIMRLLPRGGQRVAGTIVVAGRDVTTLPDKQMRRVRGNHVSTIFQDSATALNPTLTIGEQIAEAVRIHRGASAVSARARAVEMLEMVGVPSARGRLRSYPHELSGGLRQRVSIAIALVCEPKVVIADEPTTALDVTTQAQILDLLDSLKRRLSMGLLLITHDMGVVAERADNVLVMYAGRIVESASAQDLFRRPRHPYTAALLGSVPHVDLGRAQRLVGIPGAPPDLASPPNGCRFAPRCSRAQAHCRQHDPMLTSGSPEHAYACFFPIVEQRIASQASTDSAKHESDESTADPLVVVAGAVKEYPLSRGLRSGRHRAIKAVSNVSLQVMRGETLGLVGESGCGKSTLARLIVGLEKLNAGSITFNGEPIQTSGRRRRARNQPQLVFQDPYSSMNPRMRIRSVLREPLTAQRRGTRAQQIAAVRDLLISVGLPMKALDMYPHEFSGGQRQRIGLARALALEPELIVADEPVSALDVSVQAQVLNLMVQLQREHSLTYVVISHDLSVLRYMADRIGVMYLGKLVEIGPASRIYDHATHPYTAGLLSALPVPAPSPTPRSALHTIRGEPPSPVDPPSGCRFRTRCERAQDICGELEPPLRKVDANGHLAACHFPLHGVIET
jgi:oligopeptide/dipeptide ABC transporter, ATP-binding protein, C-terminal domain